MASVYEFRHDQVLCNLYLNNHIYIGKNDGTLVQMNMNQEILCSIQTGHGSISTIFYSNNKLITCGAINMLSWDLTYPLKSHKVLYGSFSYSASSGDMNVFSSIWSPIMLDFEGYSNHVNTRSINVMSEITCLYMDGCEIFVGFYNGEILKIDYITFKSSYIYKVERGRITLNDRGIESSIQPGAVTSMCNWRDTVVVSSDRIDPVDTATVIRWKCVSGSYVPDLFLRRKGYPIKIMGDQLFEFGISVVNCWSWDKIHLRAFNHSSDFNRYGSGLASGLLINGCVYLIDRDMKVWKRTGILIGFSV